MIRGNQRISQNIVVRVAQKIREKKNKNTSKKKKKIQK
jgi:hypothetical protein